jgi:hypothetical protein
VAKALTKRDDNQISNDNQTSELLKRANGGDKGALPELRRLFDREPHLWNEIGDLAQQTEAAWIEVITGANVLLSEAIARKVASLRQEIAGPTPTVLERLLADRVVICWIVVNYMDFRCARMKDVTPSEGLYNQRRQERAQRQYLAAIRTLATIRRLQLPAAIQVNIGDKQVNVTGGNGSTRKRGTSPRSGIS